MHQPFSCVAAAALASLLLEAGPLDLLRPAAYIMGFFAAATALGGLGTIGYLAYRGLRRWPARHSAGRGGQKAKALLLLTPAALLVAGAAGFVIWVEQRYALVEQEQQEGLRRMAQERQQRADRKAQLFAGLVGRYVFADTVASYPEWEKVEVASNTRACNTPPPATTRVELLIRPDSTFAYRSNLTGDPTAATGNGRWRIESDYSNYYIEFYAGSQRIVELQALVPDLSQQTPARVMSSYRDQCGNLIRFGLRRVSPTADRQPEQYGGRAARQHQTPVAH